MSGDLSRSARGSVNQLPCVFKRVLDARDAVCGLAVHQDAEVLCSQPVARAHCAQIDGLLRQTLRFVGQNKQDPLMPDRQAGVRIIQSKGLLALRVLLDSDAYAVDVQRLLAKLEATPGGVANIPLAQLVQIAQSSEMS